MILNNGNVGIRTASPAVKLHLQTSNVSGVEQLLRLENDDTNVGSGTFMSFYLSTTEVSRIASIQDRGNVIDMRFYTYNAGLNENMRITGNGNVGIGTTGPANKLNIEGSGNTLNVSNGASCSYIAAGATAFTACSSRDIKENIQPFTADNILEKISSVPVSSFDFINGSKNNIGLIAEDFYPVLNRGDNRTVGGQDVQMALWLAVQQLTKENEQLKARIAALETK